MPTTYYNLLTLHQRTNAELRKMRYCIEHQLVPETIESRVIDDARGQPREFDLLTATPQNLNEGPIPRNSVLHRVLTLLATAVAKRIRDKTLGDENSVETNGQGRFEPIHYEKEASKSKPS